MDNRKPEIENPDPIKIYNMKGLVVHEYLPGISKHMTGFRTIIGNNTVEEIKQAPVNFPNIIEAINRLNETQINSGEIAKLVPEVVPNSINNFFNSLDEQSIRHLTCELGISIQEIAKSVRIETIYRMSISEHEKAISELNNYYIPALNRLYEIEGSELRIPSVGINEGGNFLPYTISVIRELEKTYANLEDLNRSHGYNAEEVNRNSLLVRYMAGEITSDRDFIKEYFGVDLKMKLDEITSDTVSVLKDQMLEDSSVDSKKVRLVEIAYNLRTYREILEKNLGNNSRK